MAVHYDYDENGVRFVTLTDDNDPGRTAILPDDEDQHKAIADFFNPPTHRKVWEWLKKVDW